MQPVTVVPTWRALCQGREGYLAVCTLAREPVDLAVHTAISQRWEQGPACSRCSVNIGKMNEETKEAKYILSLFARGWPPGWMV